MYDQIIGSKNSFFFSRRQGSDFDGFSKEDNARRGVVSGILRKIRAIDDRIFLGAPTDRNAVYRDRRAAGFLVMVLGAVFTDEKSIHNTIKDFRPVAKGMGVASAIWIAEIKARSRAGLDLNIDDMYEAHYAEGLRRIRQLTNESVHDFETVLICVDTILGSLSTSWDRDQWTKEEEDMVARTGKYPCYRENADAIEPLTFRQPKHTNHVYDIKEPIDMLVSDLKNSIRYSITTRFGWKKRNQAVAMCFKELEKRTLEGFQRAQSIFERFSAGKVCTGVRGKSRKVQDLPISQQETHILHGVARAMPSTFVRFIDQATYAIRQHREFPHGYVHDRG